MAGPARCAADSLLPYYNVLVHLGMKTIADIERMRSESSESAYQLALIQLAGTGLDIVAYSVTLQNLCIVHILKMNLRAGPERKPHPG